jgi:hypothetical protein
LPVAPGLMSSSAAAMKTCSISVEPMPSMIEMPVACRNSCHTDAGRCSPAETQRRRLVSAEAFPAASMAR